MSIRRAKPSTKVVIIWGVVITVLMFSLWLSRSALTNWFTPESTHYRREGDAFLAEGRLAEAVLSYRQAVEADGSDQLALRALADAYTAQGRLRMAERYRAQTGENIPAVQKAESSIRSPLWVNLPVDSSPSGAALQGEVFFAGYENGSLLAVNVSSGEVLWQTNLPDPITSGTSAGAELVLVGTQTGALYALSPVDGRILWVFSTGGPIYAAAGQMPDAVFCPSSDGWLYALNPSDGSLLWKFQTAGAVNSTPVVDGDNLYFGSSDGKLYALDRSSGAPIWRDGILTGGAVESQPAVRDGRVLFGSNDGRVYALETTAGGQYWRFSTADAIYAPVRLDGEHVLVASSGNTLSAVDFISGQRLWQTDLGHPLREPPAVTSQFLYQIVESDPNLYILNASSGQVVSVINTGDWNAAGPWIARDRLILLGKDGAILAYPLAR